jgi:hypothetical protein
MPEDYWFESQLGHWIFKFIQSFQPHYGLGVGLTSKEINTMNLPGGGGGKSTTRV